MVELAPGGRPVGRRPTRHVVGLGVGLAVMVGVLLWASTRYGYHRDELYFLACGRRLAWGYPDQLPLTPFLARVSELVDPHSTLALRLPAVLMMVGVTALSALIARDLGGGPFARVLTALAVGTGDLVLLSGHFLATSTTDLTVWVGLTAIAVRLLRTGERRWWLGFGAVLGVGLLNKQLPLLLTVAFVAGILLTPTARALLRGPWPWVGAALAAGCWAPVLVWQARHGWPQLTLAGQIHDEYGQLGERIGFWAQQLGIFSPGAALLWITGLWWLARDPRRAGRAPALRALAWTWLVLMVLLAVTAGQVYYPAGLYPVLIAAGAVAAERWSAAARRTTVAFLVVSAGVVLPASLPLLTPATLSATFWGAISEPQREMVGWPTLVDTVAAAYRSIPAAARPQAVVFTANYGEAGAVEEYGPARGLPAMAYSGHNGFADWGPPPADDGPVVVVWEGRPRDAAPSAWFDGCRSFGRVDTGVDNEEGREATVWACTGPVGGWLALWPRLTHLSA